MSFDFFFSDWALTGLDGIDWEVVPVRLTVFERAPRLDTGGGSAAAEQRPPWASCETLQELLDSPGWQEATSTHENTGTDVAGATAVTGSDGNTYVGGAAGFTYESTAPVFAKAFALSVVGATEYLVCAFAPDQPIYILGDEDEPTRIKPPQSLTDEAVAAGFLFAFKPSSANNEPVIGPIGVSVPNLRWEGARAAHVWLSPQRINYVVNPSFEALNDEDGLPFGWRSNATMARVDGGITRLPRVKCVELSGAASLKVLESSYFPTALASEWWSVEAAVAGQGKARIGITFYPEDMDPAGAAAEMSEWHDLSTSHDGTPPIGQGEFKIIKTLIRQPDTVHDAVVRIEFLGDDAGNSCWVDNVLADPNEAQLGYFDGGWDFGQVGDYAWYTGAGAQDVNDPHETFSVYYNNRRALRSYLFDVATSKGRHHAVSWVPEGANVIPHWDDVFNIRTHSWMDDVYVPTLDYVDKTVVTEDL